MSTAEKQHNYFKEEFSKDESDIAWSSERQRNKVKEWINPKQELLKEYSNVPNIKPYLHEKTKTIHGFCWLLDQSLGGEIRNSTTAILCSIAG